MNAVRVRRFGGLDAMLCEDIPRPVPGAGQGLVQVHAAGVGPWDAWIRAGTGKVAPPLPPGKIVLAVAAPSHPDAAQRG